MATAQIKERLIERFRRSNYARRVKDKIKELSTHVSITIALEIHMIFCVSVSYLVSDSVSDKCIIGRA